LQEKHFNFFDYWSYPQSYPQKSNAALLLLEVKGANYINRTKRLLDFECPPPPTPVQPPIPAGQLPALAPVMAIDMRPKHCPVWRSVLPVVPIASKPYAIELEGAHACACKANHNKPACGLWLAALAAFRISDNCPAWLFIPE
jgi:hypothetical protein